MKYCFNSGHHLGIEYQWFCNYSILKSSGFLWPLNAWEMPNIWFRHVSKLLISHSTYLKRIDFEKIPYCTQINLIQILHTSLLLLWTHIKKKRNEKFCNSCIGNVLIYPSWMSFKMLNSERNHSKCQTLQHHNDMFVEKWAIKWYQMKLWIDDSVNH